MEPKWDYKMNLEERSLYPPDKIVIWYDRLYDEYVTLGGIRLDKYLQPIKEVVNKD
jgi:hypothetical protein